MTGFEPRTSGIGSDRSTNWVTTTAQPICILELCDNRSIIFKYFRCWSIPNGYLSLSSETVNTIGSGLLRLCTYLLLWNISIQICDTYLVLLWVTYHILHWDIYIHTSLSNLPHTSLGYLHSHFFDIPIYFVGILTNFFEILACFFEIPTCFAGKLDYFSGIPT